MKYGVVNLQDLCKHPTQVHKQMEETTVFVGLNLPNVTYLERVEGLNLPNVKTSGDEDLQQQPYTEIVRPKTLASPSPSLAIDRSLRHCHRHRLHRRFHLPRNSG
ncbi:hypothetical protein LXL04_034500 [Taraxacum kok-saghyz]